MADVHGATAPAVAHHFADAEQQKAAAPLGIWVFLATEARMVSGE